MLLPIISSTSILIPTAAGYITRRSHDIWQRAFLRFFIMTMFFELLFITTGYFKIHNTIFINIYFLIEFCFIVTALVCWLFPNISSISLTFFNFSIVLIWLFFSLSDKLTVVSSSFMIIKTFIIITLALYFFTKFLNISTGIIKESKFWFCIGILLFFISTGFILALSQYIFIEKSNPSAVKAYNTIHASANIISNIIFSMGFLCRKI